MPHWLLYNPFGQALSLLAAATVLMVLVRRYAIMIGMAAVCVFVLANPVINDMVPGWWLRTLASIPALMLLLLAAAMLAGKLRKGRNDAGGTAFVLPMVLYPPMVFVTGLVRLVIWIVHG